MGAMVSGYPTAERQRYRPQVKSASSIIAGASAAGVKGGANASSGIEDEFRTLSISNDRRVVTETAAAANNFMEEERKHSTLSQLQTAGHHTEGEWLYRLEILESEHQERTKQRKGHR